MNVKHFSKAPFVALCGTDGAHIATTTIMANVTCPGCLEILKPVAVPPHVAATDARRAAEMKRVTNAKLGEWSQEISLIKSGLADIGYVIEEGTRYGVRQAIIKLVRLQEDIVRAMDTGSVIEDCKKADAAYEAAKGTPDEARLKKQAFEAHAQRVLREPLASMKETRPAYIPHRFQAQGEWDQCSVCQLPEHVWIHSKDAEERRARGCPF